MTIKTDFLGRVADRLSAGIPANPHRPIRDVASDPIEYTIDLTDLPARFRQAAEAVGVEVVEIDETGLGGLVLDVVGGLGPEATVALTDEPLSATISEALTGAAIPIASDHNPATLSEVSLGITGTAAGVALTGSVVIDSSVPGGRVISLLPEIHLAVLRRADIVATPGSILRRLGSETHPLPSNLVFITGPSRSADIELQLTIGVHGPGRLIVALI